MPAFRKRPVTITAHQWFKNGDYPEDGPADREGRVVRFFRHPDVPGDTPCRECGQPMHVHGWIDTLEAGHNVCPGDWIVTGVQGERYPCKPDIFAATYDSVDARPAPAYIEIVEKGLTPDEATPESGVIVPNEVRINGIPLLVSGDDEVKVHEMLFDRRGGKTVACVTLTLFARRITVAAEGDL